MELWQYSLVLDSRQTINLVAVRILSKSPNLRSMPWGRVRIFGVIPFKEVARRHSSSFGRVRRDVQTPEYNFPVGAHLQSFTRCRQWTTSVASCRRTSQRIRPKENFSQIFRRKSFLLQWNRKAFCNCIREQG